MIPQMSVLPSRPLATKTSGGCQPVAKRAVASAVSSLHTRPPSETRLRSCTGGMSTRLNVSIKNRRSGEYWTEWLPFPSVSATSPVPSKFTR